MRVDAKSLFLKLAFAFKANLTLCLLVSLWLERKLWLLAVVSFCGSQFVENSRTFSFWAGRQGNRQARGWRTITANHAWEWRSSIFSSDTYLLICLDYQNRNTKRGLHWNIVFNILVAKLFLKLNKSFIKRVNRPPWSFPWSSSIASQQLWPTKRESGDQEKDKRNSPWGLRVFEQFMIKRNSPGGLRYFEE